MIEEIKRIIDNLESCVGMFDYLLTPEDNNLLVSYIKEIQQENKKLEDETIKLTELWKKSKEENRELKKTIEKIKEHVEEFGNGKFKVVFGMHILKIIGGNNE